MSYFCVNGTAGTGILLDNMIGLRSFSLIYARLFALTYPDLVIGP